MAVQAPERGWVRFRIVGDEPQVPEMDLAGQNFGPVPQRGAVSAPRSMEVVDEPLDLGDQRGPALTVGLPGGSGRP